MSISKEIITQSGNFDNTVFQELTGDNIFTAWSDWIRRKEPFDWFATFTFKTDILTFSQNHPSIPKVKYEKVNNRARFDSKFPSLLRSMYGQHGEYKGHYEPRYYRVPWPTKDDYERTGEYVNAVQEAHSQRMYNRWIRKLNTDIYGKRFRENKTGVRHIYAIEYQKRGVAHLHALLSGIPDGTKRKHWEQVWEGLHPNNGFCNIFPYDPELGACGYIGKYILKGGRVNISGPWPACEHVRSST